MSSRRRFLMAVSVFAVAMATGFFMQHGDALASRIAGTDSGVAEAGIPVRLASTLTLPNAGQAPLPTLVDLGAAAAAAAEDYRPLPDLPRDPDAGALPALRPVHPAEDAALPVADGIARQAALSPMGLPCAVALTAEAAGGAMVRLRLDAPCYAGAPVTLSHGALRVTEVTDQTGAALLTVPAFVEDARFAFRFDDGTRVEAQVSVPEAEIFEHVALQWQGRTALELHAFEFGADYGDPGHVFAGAAHDPARAILEGGGFLTRLGSDTVPGGWQAEVYSFPARDPRLRGRVEISVEAEITAANCAREVRGEAIQTLVGGPDRAVALTLAMPQCTAIGDFLVMRNLLQNITLAAR